MELLLEIPDILTPSQCEMLRNWNGELRYLQNFKFRRFGKKHLNDALQKVNKQITVDTNKMESQNSESENEGTESEPENTENTSLTETTGLTENNQNIHGSMETE